MSTSNILSQLGSPGVSTGFKNRIINGAMVIAQRGTSFSFPTGSGSLYYAADRFCTQDYTWSAGSNITVSNDTTVYPTGFRSSYKYATGATGLTLASGGIQFIRQIIEGYNIADCYTGNVTLSFWVRASTAGQYNVLLTNNFSTFERYTTRNYTINSANTWEQKTITIDLSVGIASGGTWNTTNGEGISIAFMLGANANRTGNDALNTWATGGSPNYSLQTNGCVNLATIANSTFYITGVQLEVGTTATNFDYRSYGTELALCQRYFQTYTNPAIRGTAGSTSSLNRLGMPTLVTMRAAPTLAMSGTIYWYDGNSTGTFTSILVQYSTISSIEIDATTATGATAGSRPIIAYVTTGSGTITASSEL